MLFTFKSATSADLIMHETSGKEILALLGKEPEAPLGIITVEQLPEAIAALQTAMAVDKARKPEENAKQGKSEPDDEDPVSLSQRAAPFVELLERAANAGEPVVWGV